MDGNVSTVNIFVASSGEMAEERKEFIDILHSLNKLYPRFKLDTIKWETDLPSGSYQKPRIQDAINPLLENSEIVFVIVYSKLGVFTLEEYNLAMGKKKKVFLYFKQGFSPKTLEQSKNHQEVLAFREQVEKENKTLYREYETIDQMARFTREDLELYFKEEFSFTGAVGVPKYLTPIPPKNVDLVGREAELKEMARMLETSHLILLVNGLGGVGKTELCKRYFWDHMDFYDHLAWVDVVGSLRESMVAAFTPEAVGCCETDTVDERFEKILAVLNGLDKSCLLVTDNIENADDADLDRLRALRVTVIANSRLSLRGFQSHPLDFLSPENCKELFYKFYTGKRDDGYVEKIIHRCGRHTLTLELLAVTAENAALSLEDFYNVLVKKGFNLGGVIGEGVHTFWHNEKKKKLFFDHLLTIFDLAGVTEGESHILANLSVLPPVVIPISDVREWLKLESLEDLNSLVFKGWLHKKEGFGIFLHQVIQEVTRHLTSPDVERCKNLIDALKWKLYLKPTENPIDKKKYVIFAETLLGHIEKEDEALATLSNNLSEIFWHMGSLEKALEFQLKALNIREQVLDKNHPYLASSYNNLAAIYKDLGQPEKALEFQLKDIEISEQVLDKNHPDLATSYNNLAEIYRTSGQPEKALEFQLKALNIREQVLDKNHPYLANSYNNLSLIYNALGQPEKALEFQLKALNIIEQVLDKNHPYLAGSFNNLSLIYNALGQPEKALEFQLKASKIYEEMLDKNHPDLANSYNNLALIYTAMKDYEPAETYGEKAVAILQHLFPNGHPDLDLYKRNLEEIKRRGKDKG